MRIAQGTAFGLVMVLSAMAWAEEPSDALGLSAPGAVVSDRDLAGTNGLGVSVDETHVTDSDGSLIVLGAGNSAAHADSKQNLSGNVNADTVTAGRVSVNVQNMRGFNVVQANSGANAIQNVTQAVNVYIIDSGGAPRP